MINLTNSFIAVTFLQFKKRYQLMALLAQFVIEMLIPNSVYFQEKIFTQLPVCSTFQQEWSSFSTESVLQTGHIRLGLEILLCLPFSTARLRALRRILAKIDLSDLQLTRST